MIGFVVLCIAALSFIILIWRDNERETKDIKKNVNKFSQDLRRREAFIPEEVLQKKKDERRY